jgi:hypothetical protein
MTLDTEAIDLWARSRRFQRTLPCETVALWIAAAVPAGSALLHHRAVWFSGAVALALALCGAAIAQERPDRVGPVCLWISLMSLLLMVFLPQLAGPKGEMIAIVVVLGAAGVLVEYRRETTRRAVS